MPLTFSTSSFSFIKSSTISQPFNPLNIEQQNNHVDNNVNKNINHNDKHNDNVDIDNNSTTYSPPLESNIKVIPLERRVRSMEASTSSKINRHNSNTKNFIRKSSWYKSIFARIHNTMLRWNDDDSKTIDPGRINNNINVNTIPENDHRHDNDVEIKNGEVRYGKDDDDDDDDDDGIIMKSRNNVAEKKSFNQILHHDFYNMNVLDQSPNPHPLLSSSPDITTLSTSSTFSTIVPDERVKSKRHSTSSVFEKCAQTPRHFTKETEVLGKVGRFTIVRESEDFDTTYFDQCHCQQKPCRFSISDCGGTHPTLEPESLSFLSSHPITIPVRHNSLKCVGGGGNGGVLSRSSVSSSGSSQHLTQQEIVAIAHQQIQMNSSSNNQNPWPSIPSSKSRRSFYCQSSSSSISSRHSLPIIQKHNGAINTNNNTNGAWPIPLMVSKVASAAASSSSISCRGVLLQSVSSPNLVHLHQGSKGENTLHNKTTPSRTNNNNGRHILIGGRHSNPNPQGYKGSYNYPHCSSPANTSSSSPLMIKTKRSSLVNIKVTDHQEQQRKLSTPPTPTTTSPTQTRFPLSHASNEPHTTINSNSGRKFEVEWTCSTAKSTSSSSTSSTSSTSSETASSPSSVASSSILSAASSPGTSVNSAGTLSRQCSTLSSKCGRKFEVTVLSSTTSTGNGLTNTSSHIDSNTDSTKC